MLTSIDSLQRYLLRASEESNYLDGLACVTKTAMHRIDFLNGSRLTKEGRRKRMRASPLTKRRITWSTTDLKAIYYLQTRSAGVDGNPESVV